MTRHSHHPEPSHPGAHGHQRHHGHHKKKKLSQRLVTLSRTLHVYLTMLGLLVMTLFGATGVTINHEDWFGATRPRVAEVKGEMPRDLLAAGDHLRIVEQLRKNFSITGAVTSFDDLDDEYSVSFKQPGEIWEVRVNRADGGVQIHHELFNFAAIINNLHRGRYTGEAWRWVIDLSAVLIVLACLTGFILWLVLPRRRRLGVAMLLAGSLTTLAVIYYLVPGPDTNVAPAAATAGR